MNAVLTLLCRMGDERRIQLLHSLALAQGAQDLSRFVLLQREDDQTFFAAVQAFVVVHRHVAPRERLIS